MHMINVNNVHWFVLMIYPLKKSFCTQVFAIRRGSRRGSEPPLRLLLADNNDDDVITDACYQTIRKHKQKRNRCRTVEIFCRRSRSYDVPTTTRVGRWCRMIFTSLATSSSDLAAATAVGVWWARRIRYPTGGLVSTRNAYVSVYELPFWTDAICSTTAAPGGRAVGKLTRYKSAPLSVARNQYRYRSNLRRRPIRYVPQPDTTVRFNLRSYCRSGMPNALVSRVSDVSRRAHWMCPATRPCSGRWRSSSYGGRWPGCRSTCPGSASTYGFWPSPWRSASSPAAWDGWPARFARRPWPSNGAFKRTPCCWTTRRRSTCLSTKRRSPVNAHFLCTCPTLSFVCVDIHNIPMQCKYDSMYLCSRFVSYYVTHITNNNTIEQ